VEPAPAKAESRPNIGGLPLDEVDAFVDLPPDMQQHLATIARLETLAADEEVSGFGAALLFEGTAQVCATIVDAPASRATVGTLVPSRGSLADGVALRVVAGENGAKVAVWEPSVVEDALKSCPWVLDELVERADRLQALAGATMGPLGDLDESDRDALLNRLTLHVAAPDEVIAVAGERPAGIMLVGAGSISLLEGGVPVSKSGVRPGELLFGRSVLEGSPAPCEARAGASGALLLTGERGIAQELFVTSPPLIPFLSGEE